MALAVGACHSNSTGTVGNPSVGGANVGGTVGNPSSSGTTGNPTSGGSSSVGDTEGAALSLWVQPGAKDGDGSNAHPFGTLDEMRDALRERIAMGLPKGKIVVWLHGGNYERSSTFTLDARDSGSADSPITWQAVPGETAHISGGRHIDPNCFVPVPSSSPIASRLDPSARDAIRQCNLATQGITDFGSLAERQGLGPTTNVSALELFVDGDPMWLARWPDVDANDPVPDPTGNGITLYGSVTPDVSGHYTRSGTEDGVSVFTRDTLVGGLSYNLHRLTASDGSYTGWFVTTRPSGYPLASHPFWYRYNATLGPMTPAQGGRGTLSILAPDAISHGFVHTVKALNDTTFTYAGDRPSRWTHADDVWVHGLFKFSWADSHERATINTSAHTITLDHAPHYGLDATRPYYVYNLVEEITQPGEYYLDRDTGILYLYPPHTLAGADIVVSMLKTPVVQMNAVEHVTLKNLVIEAGRTHQLEIEGGSDLALENVVVRNGGADGIVVNKAKRVTIDRARIYGLGDAGIVVYGGDRPTLMRADVLVENSDIHNVGRFVWDYQAGVIANGVGITVRHCHIHDLPWDAILFTGNDNLFELNAIDHVVQLSSDAGAIYTGRDWGARGNIIRNNLIEHVATVIEGDGANGVYLDDAASGVLVEGNIIYDVSGAAVLDAGGRDNTIRDNIFARDGVGLWTDARGETAINHTPGDSWNLLEKLEANHYREEPWASRYPKCAAIPDDWSVISAPGSTWRDPEGTIFQGNLGWKLGQFIVEGGHATSYFATDANNLKGVDPRFTDEAKGDLSLAPDSPALAIPGFVPIPFDKIGIKP